MSYQRYSFGFCLITEVNLNMNQKYLFGVQKKKTQQNKSLFEDQSLFEDNQMLIEFAVANGSGTVIIL